MYLTCFLSNSTQLVHHHTFFPQDYNLTLVKMNQDSWENLVEKSNFERFRNPKFMLDSSLDHMISVHFNKECLILLAKVD